MARHHDTLATGAYHIFSFFYPRSSRTILFSFPPQTQDEAETSRIAGETPCSIGLNATAECKAANGFWRVARCGRTARRGDATGGVWGRGKLGRGETTTIRESLGDMAEREGVEGTRRREREGWDNDTQPSLCGQRRPSQTCDCVAARQSRRAAGFRRLAADRRLGCASQGVPRRRTSGQGKADQGKRKMIGSNTVAHGRPTRKCYVMGDGQTYPGLIGTSWILD
jgi:hypothetical protein